MVTEITQNQAETLEKLEETAKSYAAQKSENKAKIAEARENLALAEKLAGLEENAAKTKRDLAIVEAHNAGVTIHGIAQAMGRKDRTAIYAIIGRYSAPQNLEPTPTPTLHSKNATATVTAVEQTLAGKPGWEVTLADGAKLEVYRSGSGTLMPIGPNKARWVENPELVDLIENLS